MTSILDIESDLVALDDLLFECGGDVTDPRVSAAVDAWLEELDADLKGKADNYAALITELERRAEVRRAESKRLADRARIDEANASFLRSRLKGVFERRGIKTIDTARFRLSIRANGGKAPIDLHGEVPESFSRVVLEPDRERIREALERGDALPFATLMERGTSLSIR
jgi:hypothetical protein